MLVMTKHKAAKTLEGPIAINTKGVGFFDIGEKRGASKVSIEIQPKNVNRAFNGDIVFISLLGKKKKKKKKKKKIIGRKKKKKMTAKLTSSRTIRECMLIFFCLKKKVFKKT